MAGRGAFGTFLKRGSGGTNETFTTIADVTNIKGPGFSMDTIDVTSHDSVGGWSEFVGGIKHSGEVELDLNYDPGAVTHKALLDDLDAKVRRNFQLVWPTSPAITWTFGAYVTEVSSEAPYDDKLSCSVKLKISGQVTRPA